MLFQILAIAKLFKTAECHLNSTENLETDRFFSDVLADIQRKHGFTTVIMYNNFPYSWIEMHQFPQLIIDKRYYPSHIQNALFVAVFEPRHSLEIIQFLPREVILHALFVVLPYDEYEIVDTLHLFKLCTFRRNMNLVVYVKGVHSLHFSDYNLDVDDDKFTTSFE